MRIGWTAKPRTGTRGYRLEADPTTRAYIMILNVLMVLALVGLIVGYIVAKA